MKTYMILLLAYLDVYHTIDYTLLEEEFHVTSRQIIEWMEMLAQDGYIVWENDGFYLTLLGRQYKSISWLEFSDHVKICSGENFIWDFLYIPENFENE